MEHTTHLQIQAVGTYVCPNCGTTIPTVTSTLVLSSDGVSDEATLVGCVCGTRCIIRQTVEAVSDET